MFSARLAADWRVTLSMGSMWINDGFGGCEGMPRRSRGVVGWGIAESKHSESTVIANQHNPIPQEHRQYPVQVPNQFGEDFAS